MNQFLMNYMIELVIHDLCQCCAQVLTSFIKTAGGKPRDLERGLVKGSRHEHTLKNMHVELVSICEILHNKPETK